MQKPSRLLPDDSHHLMATDCVLPQVALWGKGMVCALKRTSGLNGWISNQKHISLQSVALREGSRGFEVEQVNPLIILFALVHIAGEDKTVSFDKLQELSLIFCIPTSSFLMVVRSLSEQYPKEISYTDNSGIRNVQFLQKLNILEVLNRYYNNDEI